MWLKEFWNNAKWIIFVFVILASIDGAMDEMNFHQPHNDGYFSLTYPVEQFIGADAWHDLKKIGIGLAILLVSVMKFGWTGRTAILAILLALINLTLHELILHYL